MSEQADAIEQILDGELLRRWQLTEQAYDLMASNERPVNGGVGQLVTQAHSEFWFQHQRIELRLNDPSQGPAFVAHPETDFHGSAAASRYLIHSAADEAYIGYLIHDDPALFREALGARPSVRVPCGPGVRPRHRPLDDPALGGSARSVDPTQAARERTRHTPRLPRPRGHHR